MFIWFLTVSTLILLKSWSVLLQPYTNMIDTVHIQQNTERYISKGIDEFYLVLFNGTIIVARSMSIEEVVGHMKKKILLKEAM